MKRLLQAFRKPDGAFPAGHYYSPIPVKEEALAWLRKRTTVESIPGIDLAEDDQRRVLDAYAALYADLPFPEKKQPGHRYFYENDWYSYGDAIFLHSFLRAHSPARVIEVGSGFSSAVMLDTIDRFLPTRRPELTFIEPDPRRLRSLLREGDESRVRIMEREVQTVSLDVFRALRSGDLLFIDSSHVLKLGSDLQFLMFDVLPLLAPGVFVHFHDVFFPFEYPEQWIREGRYWNENYVLRAFLAYNSEWRIHFFNHWVVQRFRDVIDQKMPMCARNPGGGLYIRRRMTGA